MTKKEQLIQLLESHPENFLSGNLLAEELGVTRASVWKYIQQLEAEGYQIEAVTNRGYRLGTSNDVVTRGSIRRYLEDAVPFEVHQEVTSTNQLLRDMAATAPDWYTIISQSQTKGRGRRNRSFYSPEGSGIYLSILVRLPLAPMEATRITTAAAVAACRAIESCTDAVPAIKWVNDVFVRERKVCGILTEASVSMESGTLDWAVMGIGFNVYEPEGGFPEEIADIAGTIIKGPVCDLKSRLAARFIKEFKAICEHLTEDAFVDEYIRRSFLPGRWVDVIRGDQAVPALVEGIDRECQLLVRYEDGNRQALSSGEVSIHVQSKI